jgi:predicted nucleotidyltransferase
VIGLLETKREAIAEVCARYGVARLDAFGSALREDFKLEKSDVDLLVEFAPMEPYARVDAYFDLRAELRALLDREIDLVMVGAVKNPYISRDIERTKQLLYAS